jgi:cytochrome o ubiquinol oxidase subunit 1
MIEYSDIFGKLSLAAFKRDNIEVIAGLSVVVLEMLLFAYITYKKRWKWLWHEWLTSLDPKKIGVMYLVIVLLSLLKGMVDAGMMRAQQALAVGDSMGYLGPDHFQQVFTAHGATMIFFVAMGAMFGLLNLILPLQIGARDVAYPFINSLSFWLFTVGASYVVISLNVGFFSGAGWVGYPPLTGIAYNPGVGVDYWIWSVQISGVGTLLSGINFLVTILKMRCPGMSLMKMPLFVWASLASMILVVLAFPILTATLGMLSLDRYLGMHFFTSDFGGNPMMYVNLIWAWGHPEVYILVLPAFGIFSEVVATFSKKRIFGYVSMVWAIVAITFLSFIVWLHHFFTMGAGGNVNAFFGIMTMIIAIPTGVKVFNWIFTMYRGKVEFSNPMIWFIGFIVNFSIGGMAGVLLSIPPADFQLHNSLFLVAHFHSMVIPGVLFAFFAGITYWFPKIFGFKLNEPLGKIAAWCWITGFLVAFMPLYILGLRGATRRLNHYGAETGWNPLFVVAAIGAVIIIAGLGIQLLQVYVSIRDRNKNRDITGDPWDGRTLEWSTSSPPPVYNFAHTPEVDRIDWFWYAKQNKYQSPSGPYIPIELPKNSGIGVYMGGFSFLLGFALIWYIWWLAIVGFVGNLICLIVRGCQEHVEYELSVAEIEKTENSWKNKTT